MHRFRSRLRQIPAINIDGRLWDRLEDYADRECNGSIKSAIVKILSTVLVSP